MTKLSIKLKLYTRVRHVRRATERDRTIRRLSKIETTIKLASTSYDDRDEFIKMYQYSRNGNYDYTHIILYHLSEMFERSFV